MSAESYNKLLYSDRVHTFTHPRVMASLGALFGINPPDFKHCRVLDIGCARGGNIIAMALGMPHAEFVGIDYSKNQIDEAIKVSKQLGVKNVDFRELSITEVGNDLGKFDYIIVHGIFSWVPDDVRSHLMRVCKENLTETGIVYISFNTLPGWNEGTTLRELMLYRVRHIDDPVKSVQAARETINFIGELSPKNSNYGMFLRDTISKFKEVEDAYIYHEYMDEVNQPFYIHEFLQQLNEFDLEFLADVEYIRSGVSDFPQHAQSYINQICQSYVDIEQYIDFIVNRKFHRVLLCHPDACLKDNIDVNTIGDLYLCSNAKEVKLPGQSDGSMCGFQSAKGSLLVEKNIAGHSAVKHLISIYPDGITGKELINTLDSMNKIDSDDQHQCEDLFKRMIHARRGGVVSLLYDLPIFTNQVSGRPEVNAFARYQALNSNILASYLHENVRVNDFTLSLIPFLNGEHDKKDLGKELEKLIVKGKIKDGAKYQANIQAKIDDALSFLAESGLLRR